MRVSAVAALLFLAVYHALRIAAGSCTGAACDFYVPFSLLLPVLVLIMVAVCGLIALLHAAGPSSNPRRQTWLIAIAGAMALSVIGPLLALALFRDSPDPLVAIGTVLFLVTPLTVLAYSFSAQEAVSQ